MNVIDTQAMVLPFKAKRELIQKSIINLSYFTYFIRKISKSYVKYPFFIEGNSSEDEGATFIQIFDNYIKVYNKVKSKIETDYFIKIIYQSYKTVPSSFEFEYIVTIIFTGIESCLLISNFRYSKKISLPISSIYYEKEKRKKIFLYIQKKILENELDKIEMDEILINSPLKLVYDIILNLKLVNKYIKILGEFIDYDGNIIKENMIIKIFVNENGKYIHYLNAKVDKLINNGNECLIIITKDSDKYKNDIQEKIILILYGEENNSMFYMINLFNKNLSENILNKLSNQKKNMLYKLKRIIENYFINQKIDINK